MPLQLPLAEFLRLTGPILDVRSPLEFKQGHLPGSLSFPLLNNEERVQVGTVYKRHGKEVAIEQGLHLLLPKLEEFLDQAESLLTLETAISRLDSQPARFLCWRGGMRSSFTAHLLESIGYKTFTLQGGYKAFRHNCLQVIQKLSHSTSTRFILLGGLTGSGKTEVLQALRQIGEQIIDLEGLAQHRGSSFGSFGMEEQPTQEQFENLFAREWQKLDLSRPIWLEDEGRLIGERHLPGTLYSKMQAAPLFFLTCSEQERLDRLLKIYRQTSTVSLLEATRRIAKRLGGQLTKEIEVAFERDQRALALKKLLLYYDKAYLYQIRQRPYLLPLEKQKTSAIEWAQSLKHLADKQAFL